VPLYVYEFVLPDGTGGEQFEWLQPMAAAPFKNTRTRGSRSAASSARRTPPKKWTDTQGKANLSDKNLDRMGSRST